MRFPLGDNFAWRRSLGRQFRYRGPPQARSPARGLVQQLQRWESLSPGTSRIPFPFRWTTFKPRREGNHSRSRGTQAIRFSEA